MRERGGCGPLEKGNREWSYLQENVTDLRPCTAADDPVALDSLVMLDDCDSGQPQIHPVDWVNGAGGNGEKCRRSHSDLKEWSAGAADPTTDLYRWLQYLGSACTWNASQFQRVVDLHLSISEILPHHANRTIYYTELVMNNTRSLDSAYHVQAVYFFKYADATWTLQSQRRAERLAGIVASVTGASVPIVAVETHPLLRDGRQEEWETGTYIPDPTFVCPEPAGPRRGADK